MMIVVESLPGDFWSGRGRTESMFITDFDGTLRLPDGGYDQADIAALEELGRAGVVRVIATGRSLWSFQRSVGRELPIDFLVFASGAGVVRPDGWQPVRRASLEPDEVAAAAEALHALEMDYMIQRPIPDEHHFVFRRIREENPDFARRVDYYRKFARPLEVAPADFGPAAQLLAIAPPADGVAVVEELRVRLPGLNVIRTTSPLDNSSLWVEIFPCGVSKGRTTAWLAERLGVGREATAFVGNDFNDLDILDWAGTGFVVANAPDELKSRFRSLTSGNGGGVAEAVRRWRSQPEGR